MKQELKDKIKNRTPEEKKVIKVYTIELIVFAVIFVVLGILEFACIIGNNATFRLVFTYVTLGGAALLIADLIWALASKRRRARISLFDKFVVLPGPIAIIVLDILTLINGVEAMESAHHDIIGAVFIYLGLAYLAEAVYHYFYPLPTLMEAAKEEEETPGEVEEGKEEKGEKEEEEDEEE